MFLFYYFLNAVFLKSVHLSKNAPHLALFVVSRFLQISNCQGMGHGDGGWDAASFEDEKLFNTSFCNIERRSVIKLPCSPRRGLLIVYFRVP